MLQGTKLAGDWPVIQSLCFLPLPISPTCGWMLSAASSPCKSGSWLLHGGAQESRGAGALGGEQGEEREMLSPCPSTPTPSGGCPREQQHLASQTAVLLASESKRGVGNESSQAVLSHICAALVSDRHYRQPLSESWDGGSVKGNYSVRCRQAGLMQEL